MKDNSKIFLKAIANAFLPEFMDSDELKMSSISKETQDGLQQFLDQHMGDVPVGTYRQFTYKHINKFFQTKSIFEGGGEGPAKQLKTILGGFGVRRTDDGYNVIDTYDFYPRKKFTKTDKGVLTEESKKKNVGYTDVALQLAYNLVVGNDSAGVLYEPARMLGGILIPENDDRTPKDPKASNSLAIDWNISEGPAVGAKKLENNILTKLEKEGF